MGLRTGSSTAEGGTRARPLRGKVLARPSPSRADDNDCLRLPPTSPPHKSGAGKKESTVRRFNPRCQPSATPSSISSFDQALDGVRTAKSGSARKSGVSKSAKVVLGRVLINRGTPFDVRGGHRSNVDGSASGAPQDVAGTTARDPVPGEKLSLLPAKVV